MTGGLRPGDGELLGQPSSCRTVAFIPVARKRMFAYEAELLDVARNFVLVLLACSVTALTGFGAAADRYEWPTVGIAAVFLVLILVSASGPERSSSSKCGLRRIVLS